MHVLVTGGAGFIGSHTVDALLARGDSVRVLDALLPPVHIDGIRPPYLPEGVELIHGDIRDPSVVNQALKGMEAVFHLAAYQDYREDFSTFATVNDAGTALLYETIVRRDFPVRKVVLASSQAVYGEGRYLCPRDGEQYPPPRDEERLRRSLWEAPCPVCGEAMEPLAATEDRVHPHNQYAVSKYAQELYALALGQRWEIPTAVLRYSITQGPRQSFRNAYSGVLRTFALRYLLGLQPVIYEDGLQLRDYLHVRDVVRANLLVLERSETAGHVYNVGGGSPVTVQEYAALIQEVVGGDLKPDTPGIYRAGDTRHVFSDSSTLEALGWRRSVDLHTIVEDYVAWLRAQPELVESYSAAQAEMRQRRVLRQATS